MDISNLNGIGKKRLETLHAMGIYSLRELLLCIPKNYKDTTIATPLREAIIGNKYLFCLHRKQAPTLSAYGKQSRINLPLQDNYGTTVYVTWFNMPWLKSTLLNESTYYLYGTLKSNKGFLQLSNPSFEKERGLLACYSPINGLAHRTHQNIVIQALEYCDQIFPEILPSNIIKEHNLISLASAIKELHKPSNQNNLKKAQRRFFFEQTLQYQVAIHFFKKHKGFSYALPFNNDILNDFWDSFTFKPTKAQRRSLEEIAQDLSKKQGMSRMLQGDVGSGKTAVAMGAMYISAKAGKQSVMMVPTEILARQHYQSMVNFFESKGIKIGLLLGKMKAKEKKLALNAISSGEWQIIIGTHALISKTVEYKCLGLCITDEQHRFGVMQRTQLINKGIDIQPHLLVMSATPIPRSLALVLYGDLQLSIIDELPPNRKPVITKRVPEQKRKDLYTFTKKAMDLGEQIYIVCTLVEENEAVENDNNEIKSVKSYLNKAENFSGYTTGIAYGSQDATLQQQVLSDFESGKIQLLIASTVIEVGVNVPNATIMIIENADRLGLAQLHQLRGRVGRGDKQSYCFLMANDNARMRALTETNDGFIIAKNDLEIRGAGEWLGTRQHGTDTSPLSFCLNGDMTLWYEVSSCLQNIIDNKEYAYLINELIANSQNIITHLQERISLN